MELQDHEKWIKENLGNSRIPLDTAELWDEVKDFAPTKNKRRRALLWFFIGFLLCASTTAIFYYNYNTSINENILNVENLQKNQIPTLEVTKQYSKSAITDESEEIKQLNKPEIIIKEKPNLSNNLSIENTSSAIKSKTTLRKSQIENITDQNVFTKYDNQNPSRENSVISENLALSPISADTKQLKETDFIPINTLNELYYAYGYEIPNLNVPQEKITRNVSVYFLGGANFGTCGILTNNEEYSELFENNVNTVPGIFSTIGMNYKLNKSFHIDLAFDYNNSINSIEYAYNNIEENTKSGVTKLTIERNELTTSETGTIKSFTKTSYSGIWYQYSQTFALKTGLHYNLISRNRWIFSAGGGARHQLYNVESGSMLSEDFKIVQANNLLPRRINYSVNPYINLSSNYRLSNKLSLLLQTEFISQKTYLNNNTLNFSIYRLGLGCRYKI